LLEKVVNMTGYEKWSKMSDKLNQIWNYKISLILNCIGLFNSVSISYNIADDVDYDIEVLKWRNENAVNNRSWE